MALETETFADLITFTRSGSETRFNSSGVLVNETTNAACFDHDPANDNDARGLQLLGPATNLLFYSQDLTNAAWSKLNCTAALNQTDLFGTSTAASRLTSANLGTTGQMRVSQAVTVSGTNAVFWAVLRAGTVDKFRWTLSGYTTSVDCYFDLATGTVPVSPASYATARIRDLGDGRYLCWVVMPVGADPVGSWLIYGTNASYAITYTLDGTQTFDVLASQVESGTFPTSYIKTEGSQLTRNGAVAVLSGDNFSDWFNAAEASFALLLVLCGGPKADRVLLDLSDGTADNRVTVYENSSSQIVVRVRSGGVDQASLVAHTISDYTVPLEVAFTFKANDFAASVNGGSVATDGSGSVPGLDRMHIGCDYAEANRVGAWIAELDFYPERLSNAELQDPPA